MQRFRMLVVFAWFAAPVVSAAPPQLTSMTIRLTPQNALGDGCPMKSAATGQPTIGYSVATADPIFAFADPLPEEVVLSYLQVEMAILGSCPESNSLKLRLNPNMADRDPEAGTFDARKPQSSLTSCSTPASFSEVSVFSSSVIAQVRPYLRGEENELHVEELADGACGDVRIEYLDVTFHYYENVPHIQFAVTPATPEDERKVLIHRRRSDYDYLSPWQSAVPGTDDQQASRVLIRGTVTNSDGSAYANERVYLRVQDPPSPIPYMPAGMVRWFDNPYGISLFLVPSFDFLTYWQTFSTNGEGKFEAVMPTAQYLAGENQVVEASTIFLPLLIYPGRVECREDDGCYRGGTFTTWRRVYLEADRMFREGAFIRTDVPAGSTEIQVTNARPWRWARPTNPIPITIIHSGSDFAGPFYMEQRNVIRARGGQNGVLELDLPVSRDYFARVSSVDSRLRAGDAVGRTDRGTFAQHTALAIDFFQTAFTDYQVLPEGTKNVVPYVPLVEECPSMRYCTEIAGKWFENSNGSVARNNHQHLVAASRSEFDASGEIGHAVLGQHGPFPNAAFIFNALIEEIVADTNGPYAGLNLNNFIAETTVHELVHLYDVNPPGLFSDDPTVPITGGHCMLMAWDGGQCLMSSNRTAAEHADGKVSAHVQPGVVGAVVNDFGDSEYRRIRYRLDPLPQFFQRNRDTQ